MQLPFRRLTAIALFLVLVAISATSPGQEVQMRNKIQVRTGFLGPQVATGPAGSVYLLWAKEVPGGHDLYLAQREPGGVLGQARRVNEKVGSVDWTGLDELRPALVAGPDGHVAVGWVDTRADVHVTWFDPDEPQPEQWRLNAREGNSLRGFVDLAFDEKGELYAVWIDSRAAETNAEEPAHLYGVHLRDFHSRAEEVVLTDELTDSVCGCCRPDLRVSRGRAEIFFRNVTEDGYRDVHRLAGTFPRGMDELERIGPETWKIDACPMAGPVSDGRFVWWRDGSKGHSRIVEGSQNMRFLSTIAEDDDSWSITASPRYLSSSKDDAMLLVPGRPTGQLLRREGGHWSVVSAEIPSWAFSAVRLDDEVLLAGDVRSELRLESLKLRP